MILDGSTPGLLIGESWGSLSFGSFGLSLLSPLSLSSPVLVWSLGGWVPPSSPRPPPVVGSGCLWSSRGLVLPCWSSPRPVRLLLWSPEESSSRRPWVRCSDDWSEREPPELPRWESWSERVGEVEGLFSRSERVPDWLSWPFLCWGSPSRGRVGGVSLSWVEESPRVGVVGSGEGRLPWSVEVGRSGLGLSRCLEGWLLNVT